MSMNWNGKDCIWADKEHYDLPLHNIKTRIRVLKAYVCSVLLFRSEAWTISREMRKRLEAAEILFYRRMLRIPWTARRTKQKVMQRAGGSIELMTVIMKRQVGFLGHLLRGNGLDREELPARHIGGKESERSTEEEIHRWHQGSDWVPEDGRSVATS